MTLSGDQRQILLGLRERVAKKRVEYNQNNFLDDRAIILTVNSWLPQTKSLLLVETLKQDLYMMAVLDALHAWLDPDMGIAANFPNEVIHIANCILPAESMASGG